ncbi:MAG TPA: hypothetical protein VGB18_04430 [Candidatus Thermoplasmatota archaeon]
MARVLLTTLILLVILPGTTAACSLAGPVPGPGHFFLYDLATGDELEIPVHQRSLGASCDLFNPFAYDGERFAWIEGPDPYSDKAPDTAFVYDIAAEKTVEPRLTGLRHERLSLSDEYLLHVSSDGAGATKVYRYRFSTSLDQVVPISLPSGSQLLWDTQIAWRRADAANNQFFSVYDAGTSQYVLRDNTPTQLGVPKEASLSGFGEGWLLFSAYNGRTDEWWSYKIASQETTKLAGIQSSWPPAGSISNDRTYSLMWDDTYDVQTLIAYDLTDAQKTELGTVPHGAASRLVYVDGTIVLGSYSNVDPHTHEPSGPSPGPGGPGVARTIPRPPPPEGPIWAIPNLGLVLVGLVLVASAMLRRGS